MRYLIDTNVISELYRKKPDKRVLHWFNESSSTNLYLSCLTIGELRSGALKKAKIDKVAAHSLFRWIDQLQSNYEQQIISISSCTAEIWAELLSIDSTNAIDSLIAAQSKENNMVLVTRNIKHYQMFDLELFNPFELN